MRSKVVGTVLPLVVAASLLAGACGEEDDTDIPQEPPTTVDTTQPSNDSEPSGPTDY